VSLRYLLLPALALGVPNSALIIRFVRGSMLDVIAQDYVRTARAKGLAERAVIFRHAMRNALVPILTVVGLTFAALMGGAVVTETVFSIPGVGQLVVSSVLRRDYPMIQGVTLVVAASYVLINLLVDILYVAVDPRVKY
jgi:peptide/nickel transport system permease protein